VHSLFDTVSIWDTALLPLAVVLALTLRLAPETERRAGFIPNLPRAAVLGLAPLLVLCWVVVDLPHARFEASLTALGDARFPDAADEARRAADADLGLAAYEMHAGVTEAIAYIVELQRGVRPDVARLDAAIASLRRAVERDPRSAAGHANLALALRLDNDRAGATEAARAALARTRRDGAIAAVAATVLEWAGVFDEARYAYSVALSQDSSLVQSPFWSTSPFRSAVRADAIADSTLTPCDKGRMSVIYRGTPDDLDPWLTECRALVDAAPGDALSRAGLAVTLYGLGRVEEAEQEGRAAVNRVPDNPYARTALAIVLGARGDLAAVRHELMLATHLGDPDGALLLLLTYQGPAMGNVRRNLSLPVGPEQPPKEVVERAQAMLPRAAPYAFDDGVQRYLLGILHYRTRYLRESPTSILIPGEWLEFASPRALLLDEAVEAATTSRR
jgi:tetratricopeptide (TPR) repeat protein